MTLKEIRDEVWEEIGELPNLDPADAVPLAKLNSWINRGYKKILFWKFGDGTQVKFPAIEGQVYFKTALLTGTIAGSTTTTVTLASTAGANDDQYNGWILEMGSSFCLIVDYDGASKTVTLSKALDAAPTGAYSLYKSFMKLCAPGDVGVTENIALSSVSEIAVVQKIMLLDTEQPIPRAGRTEDFSGFLKTPGTPSQFMERGGKILFDCPVDEELWFSMEYVRIPPDLEDDSDVPELPEVFHDAVQKWALWRAYRWLQETDMAYSTKQDLDFDMRTTKAPKDMANDREDIGMEVEIE